MLVGKGKGLMVDIAKGSVSAIVTPQLELQKGVAQGGVWQDFSMVRGEKVAFSTKEVNSLYWFPTEGIEGSYAMIHASFEEQMEDALRNGGCKGSWMDYITYRVPHTTTMWYKGESSHMALFC